MLSTNMNRYGFKLVTDTIRADSLSLQDYSILQHNYNFIKNETKGPGILYKRGTATTLYLGPDLRNGERLADKGKEVTPYTINAIFSLDKQNYKVLSHYIPM